ncbi:UrcA family protein [Novosphingobium sp. ZN18A2]|uniref:UrcA family protein n=1 Tax=Novosphingobium sp. ZN18A2 TaxID=3079861 RepID=UPI0030CB374D
MTALAGIVATMALALSATSLSATPLSATAAAQGSETEPPADAVTAPGDTDQTITVEAPRLVKRPAAKEAHTGAEFMSTTVAIPVLYSDLDLTKDSDAERLMARIERVATDACRELDRVYPLDPDPDCITRAAGNAQQSAREAIDAARGTTP